MYIYKLSGTVYHGSSSGGTFGIKDKFSNMLETYTCDHGDTSITFYFPTPVTYCDFVSKANSGSSYYYVSYNFTAYGLV